MSNITVTQEMVDSILAASTIEDVKMGAKTTVVSATLPNGFVIVQSSSCVDPENYDHKLGKEICLKRIKDKIWEFEGYYLQVAVGRAESVGYPSVGDIARCAHEVNRAYCASIGDMSQPSWENAPEWQRRSAISGVQFHMDNPGAPPSASHDSWLKEKEEAGWKYGPVKDPEKKEHPCFVPYEQLPAEQKTKDYLFIAVVRSMSGS